MIDWSLLGIAAIPLLILTHSVHSTHTAVVRFGVVTHPHGVTLGPRGFVLHALIVIGYGAMMCGAKRGQTFGMMLMGTRAIDESGGGPIGFGRALGRAAFEYLLVVFLFVPWVIDMLAPLWDPKNQTLHEGH